MLRVHGVVSIHEIEVLGLLPLVYEDNPLGSETGYFGGARKSFDIGLALSTSSET